MVYWEYSLGSYTVIPETQSIILDHSQKKEDQALLEEFELYSIVKDQDEQDIDSLFGLGLVGPDSKLKSGRNMMQWVHDKGFASDEIASIYI